MARVKGKMFYIAELTMPLVVLSPACSTKLNIAMSFGGPAWPISDDDLNVGTVSSGHCLGAIFDITAGSSVKPSSGTPQWIVGDTFLVRVFFANLPYRSDFPTEHRKMSTQSSAPIRPQWASHNFRAQLVAPQVRNVSPTALFSFIPGMRVLGCSYVPLHAFVPVSDPSLSIQIVFGILTHPFVI